MNIDLFRGFHELLNQRWKEFGSPVVFLQLHVCVATACIVNVEENAADPKHTFIYWSSE